MDTNPVPNPKSSTYSDQYMDPTSEPSFSSHPNARSDGDRQSLYVGNLDPRVTEEMLREIFQAMGTVKSVKIIADRNPTHGGMNYGFVEFLDYPTAERALGTLNGRIMFEKEIKVNWAFANHSWYREQGVSHGHHVFVGDLGPDVTDPLLQQAFGPFGSMSDARVMRDPQSGKSREFGFVVFRERSDAEQAIQVMNGQWLGNRAIRVNWASQKFGRGGGHIQAGKPGPAVQSYEEVVAQTPYYNTTVYLGNLAHSTPPEKIIEIIQPYGYVVNTRFQIDRGYAFIKLDTHENAANAIVSLHGMMVNGRPLRCSWGKDRAVEAAAMGTAPPGVPPMYGGSATQPYTPAGYPYAPGYHPSGGNGIPNFNPPSHGGLPPNSGDGIAPWNSGYNITYNSGVYPPYYGYESSNTSTPTVSSVIASSALSAPPVHHPEYYELQQPPASSSTSTMNFTETR
ncbi:E3 ubiquitin-protein ligase pub1 [Dispira simplex]|nr:E3 ubiquitin-protein ligase pub1 [Dispira simplex]